LQPQARDAPTAHDGRFAAAQRVRRLRHRQTAEETQLDDASELGIHRRQTRQGLVERQQIARVLLEQLDHLLQRHALAAGDALVRPATPRVVDQHAAHSARGDAQEVLAVREADGVGGTGEPQPGLVDQGRRLQRVAGGALTHRAGGESAQLLVDQRQELVGGVRVAGAHPLQEARDRLGVVHGGAHCAGARTYAALEQRRRTTSWSNSGAKSAPWSRVSVSSTVCGVTRVASALTVDVTVHLFLCFRPSRAAQAYWDSPCAVCRLERAGKRVLVRRGRALRKHPHRIEHGGRDPRPAERTCQLGRRAATPLLGHHNCAKSM
jgi:hypothetical protein